MEEDNKKNEEVISFKKNELMVYGVEYYDGNEMMCAITGYDLNINFNMRLINSLADAESCADALADVFYQALIEQLIARNADFIKQPSGETPILRKESESDEREENSGYS